MAYGQGNGSAPNAGKYQQKPGGYSNAGKTANSGTAAATAGGDTPEKTRLFSVFKNKGKGYSVLTKEDITIPAGTRIGVFEDELVSKDGKTTYQVLTVKKMVDHKQA